MSALIGGTGAAQTDDTLAGATGGQGNGAAPGSGGSDPEPGAGEDTAVGQFTLLDQVEYTHDSWHRFWRFSYQPSDWTQPQDFSRGVTYFRFEVKALLQEAMLQFCYFQDRHVSEKHACAPQWIFSEPGVYYRRQENRTIWQGHVIDWQRELLDFMLIDNATEGAAKTRVQVSIIVVAAGHAFDPPANWECPDSWNCGSVDPGGTGGTTGSGGQQGTGGSGPVGAAGAAHSGGQTSVDPNDGVDSGGQGGSVHGTDGEQIGRPLPAATGGAGAPPPTARTLEGGCSVANAGAAGPGTLGAALAAALFMSRRRRVGKGTPPYHARSSFEEPKA